LEGLLLLVVFVGYTIFLLRTDREAFKRTAEADDDDDDDDQDLPAANPRTRWKPLVLTLAGLVAMAVGGPAIVKGAVSFAQIVGLSQGAVGGTIVSLGTGAEMIALGVSAARKKHSDILIGGILGSFAYNLLVTLGLAATIHTLPVASHVTFISLIMMVSVHLVLLALVWYGKISRVVGAMLVGAYIVYLIVMVLA